MTIKHITTILSIDNEKQILNLFETDIEKFSMNVFTKEDPLFMYLSQREITRIRYFLLRITKPEPYKTHLIIAENEHKQILGYILYHKHVGDPNNITIISTSVHKQYRNTGIFKKMLDILKSKYKGILLTCCIDNVLIFQKLNFIIDCAYYTQVGMNYNCSDEEGNVVGIDEDFINKQEVVLLEFKNFKNNNSNWRNDLHHLNERNNKEIEKVKKFVKTK